MYYIELKNAEYDNTKITFNRILRFTVILNEDGYHNIDDDYFDIHLCEMDCESILQSLNKELIFIYDAYAKASDSELTDGAIALKNKFIEVIK